ncbi:MAG: hypothetical protein ACKVPJ_03255 [Chitinophagales bacterium]
MQKALEVIQEFANELPLQKFLKKYFQKYKNMGARDRRQLSALVFNYFRYKGNRDFKNAAEVIVLSSAQDAETEGFYKYWSQKNPSIVQIDKKNLLEFSADEYFPLFKNISEKIDSKQFIFNHQRKPKTWIRCRDGRYSDVLSACKNHQFIYHIEGNGVLSFEKNYPLDSLKEYEKGFFEIQDIAAQKTAELFQPKENERWWDCCAGSGGKSLLLIDEEPSISLFTTDVRNTILKNLQARFQKVGFKNFKIQEIDITQQDAVAAIQVNDMFDGIIADVPCSGSGTWARTPEWLSFFDEKQLEEYVDLQRKIISNVVLKLKAGKPLIYITCSVYKNENEENVRYFTENLPLQLESEKYFQYSKEGGDTLFAARLVKKET